MELPQPRPFEAAQARKATHDFLSLYPHSPLQQDPRPSHGAGGFLKTHNFLQPLEGEEKNVPKEEDAVDINVKPPPAAPPTSVVEHVLPGGFGTYSISHISYSYPRLPKPEKNVLQVAAVTCNDGNDNNSNCSSYAGSGFTLLDESAARKENTGKENLGDVNVVKEPTIEMGQWPLDRPSQSSSNHCSSVNPLSPSQALGHKNQSFMDMIKSAKGPYTMEEDEEDVSLKNERISSQKGELRVKVDRKSSDQKANTPRSKHSATEQRRRCKINDRFQMLRELIPNSDQKRDKASFLLEVIEYIQYLHERVNRYEGSYSGWNSEPAKLNQWRNAPTENFVVQPRIVNGFTSPLLTFGAELDEKATGVSLNVTRNPQNPVESGMTNAINFKTVDQQSEMTKQAVSISSPLQPDVYAPIGGRCAVTQPASRFTSDECDASLPQLQLWQNRISPSQPTAATGKLKDQELALEGGTINISSLYSQGLLNTLTRALQSSGVDLSQASISVQVDIGNRANNRQNAKDSIEKGAEAPSGHQSSPCTRTGSTSNESDHAVKRLKTG